MYPQDISLNEWHEVKIVAIGLTVNYFLDGEKVKKDNTNVVVSGGIAILAEGAEFWLDYVEVWILKPVHIETKIPVLWATLKRQTP